MVAERLVRVKLLVEAPGAAAAGNQAAGALDRTAAAADKNATAMDKSSRASKAFAVAAGAFAGTKIIGFLNDSVNAASDLNETVSKSTQIFKGSATSVQAWSQGAAKNMGLSQAAALDAAAGFGNMFTQLGYTSKAAADLSTKTVQMAADLGSFNNLPTADVADKISGAFRGEYDSLQALIPNINAARVEQQAMADTGKTAAASLTAQEKAAAVMAIVYKDAGPAMGDYARTADGFANSQKTATASIEDQQAAIGQKLMPVWQGALELFSNVAMPVLGGIADAIGIVADAVQAIPGPVLAAAAAFAAVHVLKVPLTNMFTAVTGGLTSFRGALDNARQSSVLMVNAGEKQMPAAMRTAATAAKAAGGAMLGAFGGPIGLAVTGLTLGIGFLGKRLEGTEIQTRDFAGAIDDLTGKLDRVKAQEVVGGDTLAKMQAAGVAAGDYTLALTGNEDAIKRVHAALVANASAQEGASDSWYRANALLDQFKSDAFGVAGGLNAWEAAQRETNSAVEKAPAPTKAAEDSAAKLRDEYHKTAYEASQVAGQVAAVIQKLDEVAGRNGDAEAAQRAFNGSMRDYASAQRDIPAATRDVEQAQADLTQAQKDLTQAQKDHGKGSVEAQQAARDLAAAQDRVAEAQLGVGAASDTAAQKSEDLGKNYVAMGQLAFNQAMAQGNVAGATKAAEDAMAKAKDEWIKAQPQADILSGKAQGLADKLFGIPAEVATTIQAQDNASRVVAGVEAALTTLNGKSVTVQVYAQYKARVESGVSDSFLAGLGEQTYHATGAYYERGIQHAAAGLHRQSRMANGGANIIHWAEDSIPWESYISGDPSQKKRSDSLMGITAAKLGGYYQPDAMRSPAGLSVAGPVGRSGGGDARPNVTIHANITGVADAQAVRSEIQNLLGQYR